MDWLRYLEAYTLWEVGLLAQLLPYSAVAVLGGGTALVVLTLLCWRRMAAWFSWVPPLVRWASAAGVLLQLPAACIVAVGGGCHFGVGYGELAGRALGVGSALVYFGFVWGCGASWAAMELIGGIVGAATGTLLLGAVLAVRRWPGASAESSHSTRV